MSRVSGKSCFVNVLWSASGQRFYTGVSEDPPHPVEQHNFGDGASWTKRYRPWELVFTEMHSSYSEARRRELELKTPKGGRGFFEKTGLYAARFGRHA